MTTATHLTRAQEFVAGVLAAAAEDVGDAESSFPVGATSSWLADGDVYAVSFAAAGVRPDWRMCSAAFRAACVRRFRAAYDTEDECVAAAAVAEVVRAKKVQAEVVRWRRGGR
jgi:acyl-CoA reductase-like NAD-dependent aldehyde dehydrogenase